MDFLQTESGYIPASEITKIAPLEGGLATIHLRNGATATPVSDLVGILDRIGPVIPDNTGTYGLDISENLDALEGQPDFVVVKTPVIGWRITPDGPLAILANGDPTRYLLYKDGTVEELGIGIYGSIEEAVAALRSFLLKFQTPTGSTT